MNNKYSSSLPRFGTQNFDVVPFQLSTSKHRNRIEIVKLSNSIEMAILYINFLILQIVGFWRPPDWTSTCKIFLYNLYTTFMFLVLYSVTVSQGIEMLRSIENVDVFINNALVLLSTINACAKSANIVSKRNNILGLVETLTSPPCCPRDKEEEVIQDHFNKAIRANSLIYGGLTQVAVSAVILGSITQDAPNRVLPFNSWVPYDTESSDLAFWLTYVHQIFAMALGSYVNISYDTLVPGCMMQTCAQLEIFKHRLRGLCNISDENNNIKEKINFYEDLVSVERRALTDCVKHHLKIFRFAETSNDIFAYTIFIQFSISLIVLCASVYELSSVVPLSGDFASIILYLMAMLMQIYFFCFYGTNVTYESVNVGKEIYNMDWVSLTVPTQKSLLIIMGRTLRSITFTSGHVVVFSLESFTGLLKLSYTAYNFLQQAS